MKILITGAAGNLGSLLVGYLLKQTSENLRLMIHKKDISKSLSCSNRVEVVRADLAKKETLLSAVEGVDVIVHFAGILFKADPEKFLPETNTQYFRNLVDTAVLCGVQKVVLISFPHVEGPTSIMHPARGSLEGVPVSIHARTRLEEERYLFEHVKTPVSLRVGMVYGRGILMIDAARWLSKRQLLGVWKERTQIHLISKVDFCAAALNAICKSTVKGIYHLGDEGKISLQEFLEVACKVWETRRPWLMPLWGIYTVAEICELFSRIFGIKAPLTKDFIDIGRVSYYGDTTRMREELLPYLQYPTIHEGKVIL